MSKCCIVKNITIIGGSGSGTSGPSTNIYNSNGGLTSNRVLTASGKSMTFDMGNATFLVSGVITAKAYNFPNHNSNPAGSDSLWCSGTNLYVGNEPLSLLPVSTEASGAVSAPLNFLTPINTISVTTTVAPPSGLTVNSRFELVDSRANSSTNNIVVNFSGAGLNFYGGLNNYTINANGAFVKFRYLGTSIGWVVEK